MMESLRIIKIYIFKFVDDGSVYCCDYGLYLILRIDIFDDSRRLREMSYKRIRESNIIL